MVAAQVIAMGLISLPIMLRYGYDRRFASGVIAASGTLAQIMPPSLVLIIMADQLGRSVGDMYTGAWGPSLLQVALFCLFTFLVSVFKPEWVPAIPKEDARCAAGRCGRRRSPASCRRGVLIFLVLGTLLHGAGDADRSGRDGHDRRAGAGGRAQSRSRRFGRIVFWTGIAAAGVAA